MSGLQEKLCANKFAEFVDTSSKKYTAMCNKVAAILCDCSNDAFGLSDSQLDIKVDDSDEFKQIAEVLGDILEEMDPNISCDKVEQLK